MITGPSLHYQETGGNTQAIKLGGHTTQSSQNIKIRRQVSTQTSGVAMGTEIFPNRPTSRHHCINTVTEQSSERPCRNCNITPEHTVAEIQGT